MLCIYMHTHLRDGSSHIPRLTEIKGYNQRRRNGIVALEIARFALQTLVTDLSWVCAWVSQCVRACVSECVRACVSECVFACVSEFVCALVRECVCASKKQNTKYENTLSSSEVRRALRIT